MIGPPPLGFRGEQFGAYLTMRRIHGRFSHVYTKKTIENALRFVQISGIDFSFKVCYTIATGAKSPTL